MQHADEFDIQHRFVQQSCDTADPVLSFAEFLIAFATNVNDQAILGRTRSYYGVLRNIEPWDLIDGTILRLQMNHEQSRMTYAVWMSAATEIARTESNRLEQQIRRDDLRQVPIDDPDMHDVNLTASGPNSFEAMIDMEEREQLYAIAIRISKRVRRSKPALGVLSERIADAIVRWIDERQITLARHLAECTGLDRRRCAELQKIIIRMLLDDFQGGQSIQ